jgi:hypothetical protein
MSGNATYPDLSEHPGSGSSILDFSMISIGPRSY